MLRTESPDKSHVAMEQACCPVCGNVFDTGNILLDTQLRQTLRQKEVTGFRMCPEHQKLRDDGFTALVAIDESKSEHPLTPASVWRTGAVAHLRNEAWPNVFNVPVPSQGMCFVPNEVIDMLQQRVAPE